MTASEWDADPIDGQPAIFSHALALSALHGSAPWPDGGFPLPDGGPADDERVVTSVVLDGVMSHHFRPKRPASEDIRAIAGQFAALAFPGSPGDPGLAALHERLAGCSAIGLADPLLKEIRARDLPRGALRGIARRLAMTGSRREAVKAGIIVLGTCADERDRDLLVLLGSLEEFTLYAVEAIRASQPDWERAIFEVARRVGNWGRIHAVERLAGSSDPAIRSWLLRGGFRNGILYDYLAHTAATTGDLYQALLDPAPDAELLSGAGEILATLALLGGPAKDMRHYPDAVPAMHRFAELAAVHEPTLDILDSLLSLRRFVTREPGFDWPEREPELLSGRYGALLARPVWIEVAREGLAEPADDYGFNRALSCAARLGMPVLEPVLRHLEESPANGYAWQSAVQHATAETIGRVIGLAHAVLPVDEITSGATMSTGLGRRYVYDGVLEVVVAGLAPYPEAGSDLVAAALASRVVRVRRAALRTLRRWPPGYQDRVNAAAAVEPDPKLRTEMKEYLAAGSQPGSRGDTTRRADTACEERVGGQ